MRRDRSRSTFAERFSSAGWTTQDAFLRQKANIRPGFERIGDYSKVTSIVPTGWSHPSIKKS